MTEQEFRKAYRLLKATLHVTLARCKDKMKIKDRADGKTDLESDKEDRTISRRESADRLAIVCVSLGTILAIVAIEKGNGAGFGVLAVALVLGVLRGPKALRAFLTLWKGR